MKDPGEVVASDKLVFKLLYQLQTFNKEREKTSAPHPAVF